MAVSFAPASTTVPVPSPSHWPLSTAPAQPSPPSQSPGLRWTTSIGNAPVGPSRPLRRCTPFGQLFKAVVDVPGFGGGPYIDFLTPGVVIMTVLFSVGRAGMAFIDDMERGVMARVPSSPVRRGAMMAASMANQAVSITIQALIILALGLVLGASFSGGVIGVLVTLVAAIRLAAAFASLSNGMALLVRTPESLIGFTTMLTLPLAFLSSAMMAKDAARRLGCDREP
jgi:ABC-2 type transport system permease protein